MSGCGGNCGKRAAPCGCDDDYADLTWRDLAFVVGGWLASLGVLALVVWLWQHR